MGDKPSHGQQGADSSGSSGDSAPAAGNLADVLSALRGLTDKVAALESSVPATVNRALTERLKRAQPKGDDDAGGEGEAAPKGNKPSDPAFAKLQRDFAALQTQLAARDAEVKAAARETALRAAIAKSGVALADTEAAYRILVADFEPDEEGGLRARDPAHQAKPLDQFVKARIGAMPYLHAATGKASGAGAGAAKPAGAGDGWRLKDGVTSEELFAEADRMREAQAVAGAG